MNGYLVRIDGKSYEEVSEENAVKEIKISIGNLNLPECSEVSLALTRRTKRYLGWQ
jgi:hypothetical protein